MKYIWVDAYNGAFSRFGKPQSHPTTEDDTYHTLCASGAYVESIYHREKYHNRSHTNTSMLGCVRAFHTTHLVRAVDLSSYQLVSGLEGVREDESVILHPKVSFKLMISCPPFKPR